MNINSKVNFFVFLLVLFCSSQVSAITISFEPVDTTVNVGDSVDVDVVISGLADANEIVSTYDLFIGYDASVLTASNVTFGPYLDDFLFPSIQFTDFSNPGSLEFGEISFLSDYELEAIQPGSFTLATLTFDTITSGFSDLIFEPHPLFDVIDVKGRDALILDLTADAGGITVIEPTVSVPEPESLMLLLIGLLLLNISSRKFPFRT